MRPDPAHQDRAALAAEPDDYAAVDADIPGALEDLPEPFRRAAVPAGNAIAQQETLFDLPPAGVPYHERDVR